MITTTELMAPAWVQAPVRWPDRWRARRLSSVRFLGKNIRRTNSTCFPRLADGASSMRTERNHLSVADVDHTVKERGRHAMKATRSDPVSMNKPATRRFGERNRDPRSTAK